MTAPTFAPTPAAATSAQSIRRRRESQSGVPSASAAAAHGPVRSQALPERIQFSYTTRFISAAVRAAAGRYTLTAGEDVTPQPGDVVVARVVDIKNHRRIETEDSRKAILYEGNIVALAYGHRYAVDQFLAHVPDSLDQCHLVAAGGIAGLVTKCHDKISGPTVIEPLGLLTRNDDVVNLMDEAPQTNAPVVAAPAARPEVIAVLGTSMNAGKSTVMSCLINGLSRSGRRVGAGKITGTGAGNDRMHYFDAGAHEVIDFTDFGYGTTFRQDFGSLRSLAVNMIQILAAGNDTVLVEIADGVYQEETARLLADALFRKSVDQVAFAAVDALGARAGVQAIQEAGLAVACASGVMTSSPLATGEAAEVLRGLGVPVIGTSDLTDPTTATGLLVR